MARMANKELIITMPFKEDGSAEDMSLNYYLLSQKNDSGDECGESGFEYSYGVRVEENHCDSTSASEVGDLCPVRDEVVTFINMLQKCRVTTTTLYDVAVDWISMR